MEVRVERKKKNSFFKGLKKLHMVWKALAVVLVIGVLVGGLLWKYGNSVAQAEETKQIFRVVEVVPEKNQASLGFFIGGSENISLDKLSSYVNGKETSDMGDEKKFFYWENKQGSTSMEPFTIITGEKGKEASNNEIFRLYMLGDAKLDTSMSVYQNFLNHQAELAESYAKYDIKYQAVTPSELEKMDLTQIDYLHIGSGIQIGAQDALYQQLDEKKPSWNGFFKVNDDISWKTALSIYNRVLSKKVAISISSYALYDEGGNRAEMNLYKLYQMLNYSDDPHLFNKWIKKSGMAGDGAYIDSETGYLYTRDEEKKNWKEHAKWKDDYLKELDRDGMEVPFGQYSKRSELNYIPIKCDNVLIYSAGDGNSYFGNVTNVPQIHIILHGNSSGTVTGDIEIKVLEIEPSNSTKFDDATDAGKSEKKKLAEWLGTSPEELEITSVTPNELNGLNVDLVSDYDMIYIGDKTDQFGSGTAYRLAFEFGGGEAARVYPGLPYQHIGSKADSVLTSTLINGLLDQDKTNVADFTSLIGTAFASSPDNHFLRNIGLELSFNQTQDKLGHGRFSGNDITISMKDQLEEFIKSDQPVVVADIIYTYGSLLAEELRESSSNQDTTLDANVYFLLAETKFQGGSDEAENVKKEGELKAGDLKGFLKTDEKPEITITDSKKEETGEVYILEYGAGMDSGNDAETKLSSLKPSGELTFSYQVLKNRAGSDYIMKVILDKNGDGIFDETVADAAQSGMSSQELVGSFKIEPGKEEGVFSVPLRGGASISQFRVIVEENVKGGLRKSWTGYVRPDGRQEIKILQIMSDVTDGESEKQLSQSKAFLDLLLDAQLAAPEYDFDFKDRFTAVTASEFSDEFTEKTSLDEYNLIIVGFDYGTHAADISGEALNVLENYISVEKKPVIFARDTVSYINSEYYKTPVIQDYQWIKVTEGRKESLAGENALTEGPALRKREISKTEYDLYKKGNTEIEDKEADKRIFLEKVEKEVPKYEAVFGPVVKTELEKIPDEGQRTVYMGYWWGWVFKELQNPMRAFKNTSGKSRYVGPYEIKAVLENEGYDASSSARWIAEDYDLTVGWITASDLENLNKNKDVVNGVKSYIDGLFGTYLSSGTHSYLLKDILNHRDFWPAGSLETKDVDEKEENTVQIGDETYYLHHEKYLAKKSKETGVKDYYYYWEELVPSAPQLVPVAGTSGALYPEKAEWGYQMTKGLRSILGMDRFSVTAEKKTAEKKNSKKRDTGTAWSDKDAPEELQGFTNGMLLEYAVTADDKGKPVNQVVPYSNGSITFGMENPPRTDAIRVLNEGVVGRYPFEIKNADQDKITVEENHAAYYQLDLERKKEKETEDNVAVWFTLAGTDSNIQEQKVKSAYFEDTDGDAGNNYYLYSKANIYYTGYNLPDINLEKEDLSPAQEAEMKLFINTIYAALNTKVTETKNLYDTVLNEEGSLSLISQAAQGDNPNQYTCYYEEGDKTLKLRFRIQKAGAAEAETVPLLVGIKGEIDETTGLPKVMALSAADGAYQLSGLEEGIPITSFPIVGVAADPAKTRSLGSGVSDKWFELEMTVADDTENHILIIGAEESAGNGRLMPGGIYAEIRMVKRKLFDLD